MHAHPVAVALDSVVPPSGHTKESIMQAARNGMPNALLNLLLTVAMRNDPVVLMRTPKEHLPPQLSTGVLPSPFADEWLVPASKGRFLPNFAGDSGATLGLYEEVRTLFPRFHWRIGMERFEIEGKEVKGFVVEVAEPALPPAPPFELRISQRSYGPHLPSLAALAVFEYLLGQPNVLTRVSFYLDAPAAVPPAEPTPPLTLQ